MTGKHQSSKFNNVMSWLKRGRSRQDEVLSALLKLDRVAAMYGFSVEVLYKRDKKCTICILNGAEQIGFIDATPTASGILSAVLDVRLKINELAASTKLDHEVAYFYRLSAKAANDLDRREGKEPEEEKKFDSLDRDEKEMWFALYRAAAETMRQHGYLK